MKKMIKMSLLSAIAVASLSSSAMAGEFKIGTDVMKKEINGDVTYRGTNINLQDSLGITQKETTIVPRISYVTDTTEYGISYTQNTFEGSKTLTSNIVFNGTTYTATTDVASEISTKWLTLDGKAKVGMLSTSDLDVTIGGKIHFIDLEAQIASSTLTEKYDITFAVPAFGIGANYNVYKNLNIGGEVYGMYLGGYGNYIEYDVKASLDCTKVKGLSLNAGYKAQDFDLEADTDEKLNLEWSGFYAGLSYKF